MMLYWKIRYLDRTDRQFKDRSLVLHTEPLDPVIRAAIELLVESKSSSSDRAILKFRHLFKERDIAAAAAEMHGSRQFRGVGPSEYFEDETGAEISLKEIGLIRTGNPNSVLIPSGARQHDIDFMFSAPKPIPVAEVTLDQGAVRLLGYFVRDWQEMRQSAFMKCGPGILKAFGSASQTTKGEPTLETAASDDEIRSFVTIFRRLYMENEPANFKKAVAVYVKALSDHPLAPWVAGVADEYERRLESMPDVRPFMSPGICTFTTKRLIDVFLYTKYAHQPDERRQRQYVECLSQVHEKKAVLAWMFLTEIWTCALEMGNAGKQIAAWFKRYCDHHGVSPDVLLSLSQEHSGIGVAEKDEDRKDRLFREKVEELAMDFWKNHGRPEGGPSQYLIVAREQLSHAIHDDAGPP